MQCNHATQFLWITETNSGYSRFQIFRHDIVKKYKSRALKRKWRGPIRILCEFELSRNQSSGNQSHTKFPWTYSPHKSIYSVVFSYIVPKYLKPTIYTVAATVTSQY